MDQLIFPAFDCRIKKSNGKTSIFDLIRRKFVILTPEEWVRQHLVHFLINEMKYPKALIAIEDGLTVNRMAKRSDVVVYNRKGKVFLLAECKSTNVKLSQKSMDQLSTYNQTYKSTYLALTNGLKVFVCKIDYNQKKAVFLTSFPKFN